MEMLVKLKNNNNKRLSVKFDRNLVTPIKCPICNKPIYKGVDNQGNHFILSLSKDNDYVSHSEVCSKH